MATKVLHHDTSRRDRCGQVIGGRYRVIAPLGKGTMGSVYRGEHVALGRPVAIKFIAEHVPGEMLARKRFELEAKAMAKLAHPHCASVLDVGVHDEQPFVVMELVDGESLKELVQRGALPVPRAIAITRQILSGLAHAHEQGIIHRDIKPANIAVSQKAGLGEHVKILDFGLAKQNRETSNLTSGVIVGTPSHMAPEQIAGALLDTRVDLYACGVVLFELLTGVQPFRSANNEAVEVCMQHLHQPPPALRDVAADRDFGALEAIVAKALAKNRDDRFATAMEMSAALADVDREPSDIAAAPPRRSVWWIVAAAAALLFAAGALYLTTRAEHAPAAEQAPAATIAVDAMQIDSAPRDAVEEVLASADELIRAGRREAATELLVKARKTYPDDARLPYHAGLLYLDRMWWADGLKQLRAAIALDASLRTDAELIKAVVRGFNTTAQYDWTLASFLRKDVGSESRRYLEEVAAGHPNPLVRKRARAELRRY